VERCICPIAALNVTVTYFRDDPHNNDDDDDDDDAVMGKS